LEGDAQLNCRCPLACLLFGGASPLACPSPVAILAQVTAAHMTASASVPRQATSRSRTPSPYQHAPWWAPSPDIVDSQPPSPSSSWSNQGRESLQEFDTDEAVSRAPGEGSETGSQNKDTVDVNDIPQLNPSLGQGGLPPVGQFRRDDKAMLRRNDSAIVARLVWAPGSHTLEILGLPTPVNMLILAYAGSKWKCLIKIYEDGIVRHIWHPHMDRWTKTLVQQSILKAHHDDTQEGY